MKLMPALLVSICFTWPHVSLGHPSSGIEVGADRTVYFLDTGAGVWALSASGSLRKLRGAAYHWLALDRSEHWNDKDLPTFTGGGATIAHSERGLLISSDFPIAIDAMGALLVPRKVDAGLHIVRFAPDGSTSTFATVAANAKGQLLGWINGSAVGPDGTFYYTEDHGVWKIAPGKDAMPIPVNEPTMQCAGVPDVDANIGPHYRGIDVDADGNVYVAATACHAVIKIKPDNTATTIVRTEGAWSPTDIATFGAELYVLEYLHTSSHDRREWIPRVRKVAAGENAVIVTVAR